MRNHGMAFGYSLLGYRSLLKGLDKVDANKDYLSKELENHPEVLAEPI